MPPEVTLRLLLWPELDVSAAGPTPQNPLVWILGCKPLKFEVLVRLQQCPLPLLPFPPRSRLHLSRPLLSPALLTPLYGSRGLLLSNLSRLERCHLASGRGHLSTLLGMDSLRLLGGPAAAAPSLLRLQSLGLPLSPLHLLNTSHFFTFAGQTKPRVRMALGCSRSVTRIR